MGAKFMTTYQADGGGALTPEVQALSPWFHNLHLRDGSQTAPNHPLGDFPSLLWRQISAHLPEDLRGWTALDIGCNSGFYSFQLAQRGAKVVAVEPDPHFLQQAKWAAAHFDLLDQIEFRQQTIYALARSSERYDLVLFLGVFYHLRYPLLGLDIATGLTRRLMVFQSLSLPDAPSAQIPADLEFNDREVLEEPGWPKLAFIENALAGDPTNWWIPNRPAIEAMLRTSGMDVVGAPAMETYLCKPREGGALGARFCNQQEFSAAVGLSV